MLGFIPVLFLYKYEKKLQTKPKQAIKYKNLIANKYNGVL